MEVDFGLSQYPFFPPRSCISSSFLYTHLHDGIYSDLDYSLQARHVACSFCVNDLKMKTRLNTV